MINKKNKATLIGIVALTVISGGMFAYQNIYMPKQQQANTETVYLANQDIQAYTTIDPSMFDEVKISKSANMNMYVDDISSVKGQKLKGGLLKGEPLNKVRLTKDDVSKDEIITPIEADFQSKLSDGDFVNVYVLLSSKTEDSSVKNLLKGKKASVITSNDGKSQTLNLSLSEKELSDYFVAKSKGTIIVAKVNNLDIKDLSTEDTEKLSKAEDFDATSPEVQNAVKESEDSKELAISYYVVKEGDTLESLSIKFKTTEEKIAQLNNGKTEFEVNEQIAVPAI